MLPVYHEDHGLGVIDVITPCVDEDGKLSTINPATGKCKKAIVEEKPVIVEIEQPLMPVPPEKQPE